MGSYVLPILFSTIMGLNAALQSGILNDMSQYRGDAKLMRARGLLQPEERPTVPVELQDPGYVFEMSKVRSPANGALLPIRLRPEAGMVTTNEKDRIVVNRKSKAYNTKDLRTLAAQLAHEQVHVQRPDNDEADAYRVQLAILDRLGYKKRDLLRHLQEQQQRALQLAARGTQ